MYTFKCPGISTSICMTASDDNDELEGAFVKQPYVLHSSKFLNVCLCMIMYMWELFTRVEFSVEFSMKGHTSGLAQSQFQPYYKKHSRFLHFRKFRLVISSTWGVMFTYVLIYALPPFRGTLANGADPDQST